MQVKAVESSKWEVPDSKKREENNCRQFEATKCREKACIWSHADI